jgi:hypothetical protein
MRLAEGSERASRNLWLAANFAVVTLLAVLRGYMDRSSAKAYGYDLTSFSLLLDQYRESGFVFGIKNDVMDGLGGYTYHWNPMLQPDMVLGALFRPTYEFGVTVAFLLIALFASTLFLARSLGISTTLSLQAGWLVFMFTATPWADMLFVEPPYLMMLVWLNLIVGTFAHALRCPGSFQGSALVLLGAALFTILSFTRPFAVPFILPSLLVQLAALIAYRRSRGARLNRSPSSNSVRAMRIAAAVLVVVGLLYSASFIPIVMSTSAAAAQATQENGLMSAFGGYIIPSINLPGFDASSPLSFLASSRRLIVQFFIQAGPALFTIAGVAGAAVLIRCGPRLLRNYAIGALVLLGFFTCFALLSQIVSTTIRIRYSVMFALPQLSICAIALVLFMGAKGRELLPSDGREEKPGALNV